MRNKAEIIEEIIVTSDVEKKIRKFVDVFLLNLLDVDCDEEDRKKMENFKKEFSDRYPKIVANEAGPIYSDNFTEEELEELLEIIKNPVNIKLLDLSEKIEEVLTPPIEKLFTELVQKHFN